jgi:hypothetical protein
MYQAAEALNRMDALRNALHLMFVADFIAQQLKLRPHAGKRCAQLMGGIRHESLLRFHGSVQALQQAIELPDQRPDFGRNPAFSQRFQIILLHVLQRGADFV